jgi:membrane-associated phospholipid phosphatase
VYIPWLSWFYLSLAWQPLVEVRHITVATLTAVTIGYTLFFTFPTHVVQQPDRRWGIWKKFYDFLVLTDKDFNACPSMHVYMCVILSFFMVQRSSSLVIELLVVSLGLLIIVSTVLTKRHYVYDVAGGIIVGIIAVTTSHYLTPFL